MNVHGYKLPFPCHRLNINFHDITINSFCLFSQMLFPPLKAVSLTLCVDTSQAYQRQMSETFSIVSEAFNSLIQGFQGCTYGQEP